MVLITATEILTNALFGCEISITLLNLSGDIFTETPEVISSPAKLTMRINHQARFKRTLALQAQEP